MKEVRRIVFRQGGGKRSGKPIHYKWFHVVLMPDQLKAGRSVEAGGSTVTPEMVVGPAKRGRSFAYVTDTRPCESGRILARSADLLYHEATFTETHADRAVETGHSTAREAAEIAREAGARRLLIGHFSARHTDPAGLLDEATAVFQNTEVAEELKRYLL